MVGHSGEYDRVHSHLEIQSYEILKLTVTLKLMAGILMWASAVFPLVREKKNHAEDVDVALEPSEDLISINQQGSTDLFVGQDL